MTNSELLAMMKHWKACIESIRAVQGDDADVIAEAIKCAAAAVCTAIMEATRK